MTVDVSCCIATGSQETLRMSDIYLDLDLQMQIVDLVSHFHLYHTIGLALNCNISRQNDRKIRVRSII